MALVRIRYNRLYTSEFETQNGYSKDYPHLNCFRIGRWYIVTRKIKVDKQIPRTNPLLKTGNFKIAKKIFQTLPRFLYVANLVRFLIQFRPVDTTRASLVSEFVSNKIDSQTRHILGIVNSRLWRTNAMIKAGTHG